MRCITLTGPAAASLKAANSPLTNIIDNMGQIIEGDFLDHYDITERGDAIAHTHRHARTIENADLADELFDLYNWLEDTCDPLNIADHYARRIEDGE